MSEPVRVRDCACPGKPHEEEGDVVYVAQTLGLAGGLAAEHDSNAAVAEALAAAGVAPPEGWPKPDIARIAADAGERLRIRWMVTFVRHGAVGWNLVNERGPRPFDVEVLLADYNLALPVAERCDELFGETVSRPLVQRLRSTLPSGSTDESTSPTNGSTRRPRKRSSRATTAASKR